MSGRIKLLSTVLMASTLASACSGAEEAASERVDRLGAAVLDGTATPDGQYAAVGALVYYLPELGVLDTFCTGTLIADSAVVTARHCTPSIDMALEAGLIPAIAFGSDPFASTNVVPITSYVAAPAGPGGLLLDGGRDVAVAYLESKPAGIKPAKLGMWDDKMLGDDFKIAGYGVYESDFSYGLKHDGTVTARSLKGDWYSLLFNGDYDAYLEWYFTDSSAAPPTEEGALEWWNIYKLEKKYELYAGNRPGDSNPCFGDSGGPLFKASKKDLTVYGVSFAVEASASEVCIGGGAYLIFNKKMHDFVKDAVKHCRH